VKEEIHIPAGNEVDPESGDQGHLGRLRHDHRRSDVDVDVELGPCGTDRPAEDRQRQDSEHRYPRKTSSHTHLQANPLSTLPPTAFQGMPYHSLSADLAGNFTESARCGTVAFPGREAI